MTTLQILIVVLGALTATALFALGWAFLAIAKLTGGRGELPCCYRPDIVDREWEGQVRPFCMNCGLYQRSPLEAATTSSPGTSGKGGLGRPTEGRSDAA